MARSWKILILQIVTNKVKDIVEEDKIRAVKNAKQAGRRIKE